MTLPGMRGRAGATAVATLAALTLAACSSSGGSGPGSRTGAGAETGAVPTNTAPAGGTSADAATTAAVKNAYAKFFSPDTPENVSLGLLQNGPKFKAAVDQQASGSMAATAAVQVSKVSLVSANTAKVNFTIFVNKQPMLKDQPGYAVKTNGTWQVSEYTFCGLLTLEGGAPAECKQPEATTAPK